MAYLIAQRQCNPSRREPVVGDMQNVIERARHASPGSRPQPLAFLGKTLWMGSWDTDHIYAIDPQTWKVIDEVEAPGKPYGLAAVGDGLRVVVSLGEEDDRYLYHFVPGKGFDAHSKAACPDFTGSALASDGTKLYLAQMGNSRIVELDDKNAIVREIALPSRCGGMAFYPNGTFCIIAADDEWENLQFATLDISLSAPEAVEVAAIPFDARGLAYDGSQWWTSHREASEIVAFTVS